jgi:hypothetical protein
MKNILLVIILFLSFKSLAQKKFIEVQVTDTISLKPLRFQLHTYIDILEQYDPYGEDTLSLDEKAENKFRQIKLMLEEKKYKVDPFDNSKLKLFYKKPMDKKGFTITLNSLAEVKILENILEPIQDLKTVVSVLEYAEVPKAEEQLIKKIIVKAKAKALVVANASGLHTGQILELKENNNDYLSGLNDLFIQMSDITNLGQQANNYSGTLSRTFTIKFAAE